ncbi:Puf2p PWA37_004516 [Arxiozyma heterogenica]|uniref:Puf2p n=1 Tax=Arxiozyma heterogenica TaxID=278026 RepID=UPI002EDEBD61
MLKEGRDHSRKLGSYRRDTSRSSANSSKLADRFSGFLPSFSSKFLHSKPQQPPEIKVTLEDKLAPSVMQSSNIPVNPPGNILSTPEPEPPIQFPTSSNTIILDSPIKNRQRTNTAPINWDSIPTTHLTRTTTNYSEKSIWTSNEINNSSANIPILSNKPLNNKTTNTTYLNPNHSQFNTGRKRSQTMASYGIPQSIISNSQHVPDSINMSLMGNNNNISNTVNIPLMQDDIDPFSLVWITTNQKNIPHINLVSAVPSSSTIAISNIFPMQWNNGWNTIPNLTSVTLATIFSQFGRILSVRTLKDLYVSLIEFENIEHALLAMDAMQDKEISMVGVPCKITFAKILSYANLVIDPNLQQKPHSIMEECILNGTVQFQVQPNGLQIPLYNDQYNPALPLMLSSNTITKTIPSEQETSPFPLPPSSIETHRDEVLKIIRELCSNDVHMDENRANAMLESGLKLLPCADMSNFGSMPEPVKQRQFETPKLREIRKSLDNNQLTVLEIEQLALCMLDELPELSLDYLGNTIVQRLYDKCDDLIRDIILRKLKSYMSIFGIHKSGTWVCQKLIKTARIARHIMFIIDGVEPYCAALFNDQFGNYVIQEVVKFGPQWNQFIFSNIIANFWTICVNRYGVRAIRACLETTNGKVTDEQLVIIGSIVVVYGEYLITDHNGTLLITWLLDTLNFNNKYLLLTKHILPYLSDLCCHKLGSLTVLKILNSRGNELSKKLIIEKIFNFHDTKDITKTLRYILRDTTSQGPSFLYKMISSRLVLDYEHKEVAIQQIRTVLLENPPRHPHHRLMEEIGLITTSATASRW